MRSSFSANGGSVGQTKEERSSDWGGRTVMHHPGQADSFFLSVLVVTIACRFMTHTGAVRSLLTQMSPASFIWASVLYPTQCVPASRFSLPPS